MNERIKLLAKQCWDERPEGQLHFDNEKFALLIVRECAKFLAENSGYDNSNNAWHPEPEDLLKHFGVEE